MWRGRSVFARMVTTYLVLMAVLPSASHAYETWHVVDVPRVVCPKQGNMSQEAVIEITYTPELIVDKYHVFSFLRVSKQQVDVTFHVHDSGMPPQTVVEGTTLQLEKLTGAAKPCPCTGQGVSVLGMTDYGSTCKAWDKEKCEEINGRPTGQFCCESWCYVNKDCPSGWESAVSPGKFFSYAACQASTPFVGTCPYPTAEEKKEDPCNCIENPYALFTDKMKMSLTKSYGAQCDAHDYKSKTCDPTVGFYTANQVDAWCCKYWCYVDKKCPSAIPSINEGVKDKLFWSEIVCDNEHPIVLKMLAQCPYKRMGEVYTGTEDGTKGWVNVHQYTGTERDTSWSTENTMAEMCACKAWGGMPIDLRTSFGIKDKMYGKHCYPWDQHTCKESWPGSDPGMWCCQSWCYVDPECPKANKDSRWADGYISTYPCKDEANMDLTEAKDAISSCAYSPDCECTGSNDGLNSTWKKRLGLDYGKKCKAHDFDCEAKWPGSDWGNISRTSCCNSWCYVSEKCPLAEKSWTGANLWFNYDTCDDDKSLEYDETQGKCKSVGYIALGDPLCTQGLLSGPVCCPSTCGTCDGKNCSMEVGGAENCCRSNIMAVGAKCSEDGAPCVIEDPDMRATAKTAQDARLTPDPDCLKGVESTDDPGVCCAPTCKQCGGTGCGAAEGGGPENCCTGRIEAKNVSCKEAGPPCVIGSRRLSEEESFMGDWAFQSPEVHAAAIEASQNDRRFLRERQRVSESENESENDSESESESEERRLSARRRGGGGFSSPRRRSPPPDPRRRAPSPPRRRAPSRPSGKDTRRRAPPPPRPVPSPSGQQVNAARRRAPAPAPGKPAPVAQAARRRATGMGGKRYNTQTSKIGGKSQGVGYTQKNQMQKNFGGQMPQKASYGYSGANAARKNDKVKMAMAAAGGVALGVGAYYAYNKYQDYKRAQDQSWCEHTKTGEFLNCNYCRRTYGMGECREEQSCFQGTGCSYTLKEDVNRDDLMITGFLPNFFTPPLIVKITAIKGQGLSQKDLKCDQTSLEMAKKNISEAAPISFKPLMYLTLTQMDQLDDPGGSQKALADSASSCRPGLLALTLALALGLRCNSLQWQSLLLLMGVVVYSTVL